MNQNLKYTVLIWRNILIRYIIEIWKYVGSGLCILCASYFKDACVSILDKVVLNTGAKEVKIVLKFAKINSIGGKFAYRYGVMTCQDKFRGFSDLWILNQE